jgi:hypothetical protein
MIEAAQAEVHRLTEVREQSHAHLRELQARLGDLLGQSVASTPDDAVGSADDVLRPVADDAQAADPQAGH